MALLVVALRFLHSFVHVGDIVAFVDLGEPNLFVL